MADVEYVLELIEGRVVLVRRYPEKQDLFPDTMNARGRQSRNRYHNSGYQPKGLRPGWRA
jgi:hypothetical protein